MPISFINIENTDLGTLSTFLVLRMIFSNVSTVRSNMNVTLLAVFLFLSLQCPVSRLHPGRHTGGLLIFWQGSIPLARQISRSVSTYPLVTSVVPFLDFSSLRKGLETRKNANENLASLSYGTSTTSNSRGFPGRRHNPDHHVWCSKPWSVMVGLQLHNTVHSRNMTLNQKAIVDSWQKLEVSSGSCPAKPTPFWTTLESWSSWRYPTKRPFRTGIFLKV